MDKEQAFKISLLRKEKMKDLYRRMFLTDEVIEFKIAMKKLEKQAEKEQV